MQNETIMPVRHGLISGTAVTTAEAAKGGFGGFLKGGLIGIGGSLIGGPIIGAVGLGLVGLVGGAIIGLIPGIALVGAALTGATYLGVTGAVLGGVAGIVGVVPGAIYGSGFGGLFGLFQGASKGVNKVGQERGAATMVNAELEAYKAQAMAAQQATTIYAPSAANHNYAGASTKNMAPLNIQGGTGQDLGTINGMQLQRA